MLIRNTNEEVGLQEPQKVFEKVIRILSSVVIKNVGKRHFLRDIGLIQVTSFHYLLPGAGFYKSNVSQYPPSHLQDYSTCNCTSLSISCHVSIQCCMKNDLLSGDSNPRPLGHESFALTPRSQQFSRSILFCFVFLRQRKINATFALIISSLKGR